MKKLSKIPLINHIYRTAVIVQKHNSFYRPLLVTDINSLNRDIRPFTKRQREVRVEEIT